MKDSYEIQFVSKLTMCSNLDLGFETIKNQYLRINDEFQTI